MKTTTARFSVGVLILSCGLAACDGKLPKAEASSTSAIPDATTEVVRKPGKGVDGASQVLDDATITAKVKWALAGVMDMRSMEIFVETVEGRVTLSGNVASTAESRRAANLVGSLEGVKGVKNRLAVKIRV